MFVSGFCRYKCLPATWSNTSIRSYFIESQWICRIQCRFPYENASRTGVRILPNKLWGTEKWCYMFPCLSPWFSFFPSFLASYSFLWLWKSEITYILCLSYPVNKISSSVLVPSVWLISLITFERLFLYHYHDYIFCGRRWTNTQFICVWQCSHSSILLSNLSVCNLFSLTYYEILLNLTFYTEIDFLPLL